MTLDEYAENLLKPQMDAFRRDLRAKVVREHFKETGLPEEAYAAFEAGFLAATILFAGSS